MPLLSNISFWIRVAGFAQIALALGSLTIPRVLKWSAELSKTNKLIKQMFWIYAAYIFVINLCFGLISFLQPGALLDGSTQALLLTGFIAVYWISRVFIQFFYFDRQSFPSGKWPLAGEAALVLVFVLTSIVYSLSFYHNLVY